MDDDPSDKIRPDYDVSDFGRGRPDKAWPGRARRRRRRSPESLDPEDTAPVIFIFLGFVLFGAGLVIAPLSLYGLAVGGRIWLQILLIVFSVGMGLVGFGLLTVRQGFRMRADARAMKWKDRARKLRDELS